MAKRISFKKDFDQLAVDGCIGDPEGKPGYAYIRVSSAGQAEEGTGGLPRQIQNIHEVAQKKRIKIPWDMVFADDHTGFYFEDRPELSRLRKEYKSPTRRANVVVMEYLDRLSRNSDWHSGFLLDEMKNNDMEAIFWKPFSSRIERAVQGAIAQDGMENAIERMKEGTMNKAKDGRITAKVPAYGYKFVDQFGNEHTQEARKHTYYAIDEDKAVVVRFMFNAMAFEGYTSHKLVLALDERAKIDKRFMPTRAAYWGERQVVKMLRNPVYKGEYIANRHYKKREVKYDEHGVPRHVLASGQRPETEWIRSTVQPLVDEGTWELANRNLYKNKDFSQRNKKNEYLLTGLIRCASCGWRYHGQTEGHTSKHVQRYYCSKIYQTPAFRAAHPCNQGSIRCEVIDPLIWEIIAGVLLDSTVLLQAIDAKYSGEAILSIRNQIAFVERELGNKESEEQKLRQAYLAGAFTPEEFAGERRRIKNTSELLAAELASLRGQVMTPEELRDRKAALMKLVANARQSVNIHAAPLSVKRQIIRLLVDEIVLHTSENWFEIHGAVGDVMFRVPDDIGLHNAGNGTHTPAVVGTSGL